ncbi:hypothetical protein Bbelb_243150 [Branchiostoma belcheri]|nr:hypothetical protein Bbelb_243150 [Branchiostoma belcheri]
MSSDKNLRRWFRSSISSQLANLRKAKKNGKLRLDSQLQTLLEPIEEALKRRRRRTQASPTLDEDNEDIVVSTSLQKPTVPVSVTNEEARRLLPRWDTGKRPIPSFWPADVPWIGKINNLSSAHLREATAAVVIHVGEDPESFHAGDTRDRHAGDTRDRHAGDTRDRHAGGTRDRHAGGTRDRHAGSTRDRHAGDTRDRHAGSTRDRHAGDTRDRHAGSTRDRHAGGTRDRHAGGTSILNPWSRSTPVLEESFSLTHPRTLLSLPHHLQILPLLLPI